MHRFTDTNKWTEDWYCELKGEYQKLWDYICDHCDNAGIWKPNKIDFEIKTGFKVSLDSFLKKVNGDKLRIAALANGRWFIPGFIQYQWFTKQQSFNLVLTNPRHKHIYEILVNNCVLLTEVRGLKEVWKTSKAKAREEEEEIEGTGEKEGDKPHEQPKQPHDSEVCYDAEQYISSNRVIFERCCIGAMKTEELGLQVLKKYHLWNVEKSNYPMPKKALIAGFSRWLINEKSETNGRSKADSKLTPGKLGTSEARIATAKKWGLSAGEPIPGVDQGS